MIKLWLDDIREAPEGWHHVTTVQECIDFLSMGECVEAIDLDNDLGDCDTRQGYEVMDYIEGRLAMLCAMPPKNIFIHTANPSAAQRMKITLENIRKMERALRIQQGGEECAVCGSWATVGSDGSLFCGNCKSTWREEELKTTFKEETCSHNFVNGFCSKCKTNWP